MKTDSIGRRARHIRQPLKEQKHFVTPRDITWLAFLHRHGGRLPTSYLHDYTKANYTCFEKSSERLKTLHHELRLIDRPFQQFETLDPRCNELVHEASQLALDLLKEQGLYSDYAPSPRGAFKHQLMLSCVSASFELNSIDRGYKYTPQHELLERVGHDHTIDIEGDKFVPDQVFMLTIDGKDLLIFLEIDRGTEPTESEAKRKSWKQSIGQYQKLIGGKLYKERFNVTCGALLMVVTISPAKQAGILKVVHDSFDGRCNYILVNNLPEFGRIFHPPRLLDMLGAEWSRCGYPPFKLA